MPPQRLDNYYKSKQVRMTKVDNKTYNYIADMDPDDLQKYRILQARDSALMLGVETDFEHAVEVLLDVMHEDAYVLEKYGIDNNRQWTVDLLTGKIYYLGDMRKRPGGPRPRRNEG